MNIWKASIPLILTLLAGLLVLGAPARQEEEKKKAEAETTRVHVKVTAAESGDPLRGARVRVRSNEEDSDGPTFDENSTTGSEGAVTFSKVPRGKILVQVTLAGRKNFGQEFVLDKKEQTIAVELEKEDDSEHNRPGHLTGPLPHLGSGQ